VHVQNKYAYQRLTRLGAEDLPTGHHHTALFAAVYSNDMPVVQELIARGSNINQFAQNGFCTLVYCAARYGHLDMLKYLLSLGLRPEDTEESNAYSEMFYGSQFTALTAAVKNGDVEAVELLLKAGANPNRRSNGIPPLHFAAPRYRFVESETIDYLEVVNRYIAIIDLLLAYGADINLKADHNHITCLIQAIATDQEEIAMHLVKSGAAIDKKDKRGKLPLDYARSFNQNRLAGCL
jgi:ankyrin repeat protein